MGRGIKVKYAGTRVPSKHFEGHFLPSASVALRGFVADLIDGKKATLADALDVMPRLGGNTHFAQFAVVDTSVGETGAFSVTFLARTAIELGAAPANSDPRGTPSLLGAFHDGAVWEAYNCHIVDFQVYPRAELYAGRWPQVPME